MADDPAAPPPSPETLMDQARAQYPILPPDIGYKYSAGRAPFMLEHWGPGMAESIPGVGRPEEFPPDKFGIEVYDPKTRPIDILGDVVSHRLINSDPKIKEAYSSFKNSFEPWQEDILREQYEHAQKNEGETRSFEQWKEVTGVPAYFRGYPFQQWPEDAIKEMYTPQQLQRLDEMMSYLLVVSRHWNPGSSHGAQPNPRAS